MEKRENGLVDIVKFICAIIVVAGHCYLADVEGYAWFTNLVTLAVQVFFIFTGYYLVVAGTLSQESKAVSYVRHLFTMTMIWAVLYFVLNLLLTDKSSQVWGYDFINLWTEFLSSFNSGHLWYLQNMLIVVVLLLGLKKVSFSWKEVLAILLISTVFYGRITKAVLGIAVGMYLAGTDAKEDGKKSSGMLLIGVGTAAVAGGILWLAGDNAAVAGIMTNYLINIISILIAYAALHIKMATGKVNFVYLRKQSTIVYLVHLLLVPIVAKVMGKVFAGVAGLEEKGLAWCLILTVVVTVGSVIAGSILMALSKKEKLSWLKKLY